MKEDHKEQKELFDKANEQKSGQIVIKGKN